MYRFNNFAEKMSGSIFDFECSYSNGLQYDYYEGDKKCVIFINCLDKEVSYTLGHKTITLKFSQHFYIPKNAEDFENYINKHLETTQKTL